MPPSSVLDPLLKPLEKAPPEGLNESAEEDPNAKSGSALLSPPPPNAPLPPPLKANGLLLKLEICSLVLGVLNEKPRSFPKELSEAPPPPPPVSEPKGLPPEAYGE